MTVTDDISFDAIFHNFKVFKGICYDFQSHIDFIEPNQRSPHLQHLLRNV